MGPARRGARSCSSDTGRKGPSISAPEPGLRRLPPVRGLAGFRLRADGDGHDRGNQRSLGSKLLMYFLADPRPRPVLGNHGEEARAFDLAASARWRLGSEVPTSFNLERTGPCRARRVEEDDPVPKRRGLRPRRSTGPRRDRPLPGASSGPTARAYRPPARNFRGEVHTDRVVTAPLWRSTVLTTAAARPSIVNSREYHRICQPPGSGRTTALW